MASESIGGISAGAPHHPPFGHLLQRRRLEREGISAGAPHHPPFGHLLQRRRLEMEGFPLFVNRSFDFAQDDECGEQRGRLLPRLTPAFQALPLPKEEGKKRTHHLPDRHLLQRRRLEMEVFPLFVKRSSTSLRVTAWSA